MSSDDVDLVTPHRLQRLQPLGADATTDVGLLIESSRNDAARDSGSSTTITLYGLFSV